MRTFLLFIFYLKGFTKNLFRFIIDQIKISVFSKQKVPHCFRCLKKIKITLNLKEFFLFSFASAVYGAALSQRYIWVFVSLKEVGRWRDMVI